jgi:hypothetical protein
MPIHEFPCEKRQEDSEVLVRSRDWQGALGPHCGSKKLSRQLSTCAASSGTCKGDPAHSGGGNPHSHQDQLSVAPHRPAVFGLG